MLDLGNNIIETLVSLSRSTDAYLLLQQDTVDRKPVNHLQYWYMTFILWRIQLQFNIDVFEAEEEE